MTTWELLLMGARVRDLKKEGLINISDTILLQNKAFDQMFPTGWEEEPFVNSNGENVRFRTIKIDGHKFVSVRYEGE